MEYIKCSEKELNALEMLVNAIETVEKVQENDSDVKHDLEVVNGHDLSGLSRDIEYNPIFEAWKHFKRDETKVIGYDETQYTGIHLISINSYNQHKAFGYYEENGEKIFFMSDFNSDTTFIVEDTEVDLNGFMRVNL